MKAHYTRSLLFSTWGEDLLLCNRHLSKPAGKADEQCSTPVQHGGLPLIKIAIKCKIVPGPHGRPLLHLSIYILKNMYTINYHQGDQVYTSMGITLSLLCYIHAVEVEVWREQESWFRLSNLKHIHCQCCTCIHTYFYQLFNVYLQVEDVMVLRD